MMTPEVENLIVKWFTKSSTSSDLDALIEWIKIPDNEQIFKDFVLTHYAITFSTNDVNADQIKERLLSKINKDKSAFYKYRLQSVFKYAAILIVALGIGHLYTDDDSSTHKEQNTITETIIQPGIGKATLTLDDGSEVALEKGTSFHSKNANSNGEQIVYDKISDKTSKIAYNYLTIPRGGEFFIKLSDGTQIWLNSESQLKYPVEFTDGETRQVELIYGEAYFDVSPDSSHNGSKFKVVTKMQEIQVLGTEFNVKAYKGEYNIYTTLIEGKVAVTFGDYKQNLTPNQQSNLSLKNNTLSVVNVDVYSEISWKNGVFSFEGKSLKDIMKVLSRWYDMDVVFKNKEIEREEFNGILGKDQDIEEILSSIKNYGIIKNYEIKDKKVVLE